MKCKHQHSGRGLLLTITTSIGNYLYAGEIRVKTHFMSRETHSTDQGKMRNQLENMSQAQSDQNKPMQPSKPVINLRYGLNDMIFALYCLSAWEIYLKTCKTFAKLLFDMPKSYQSHMMILLESHIHICYLSLH